MDDVAPFAYELARLNGQGFKARQADMYAAMFAQAAADLGDDGITFSAAKDLIGMPRIKRWWRDGRGVDFFDYHPMNDPYKNILSTTFTTVEEVRVIYERKD